MNSEIFRNILSVPQNIVMSLNNVMWNFEINKHYKVLVLKEHRYGKFEIKLGAN